MKEKKRKEKVNRSFLRTDRKKKESRTNERKNKKENSIIYFIARIT
jgi:hypothetical protein